MTQKWGSKAAHEKKIMLNYDEFLTTEILFKII